MRPPWSAKAVERVGAERGGVGIPCSMFPVLNTVGIPHWSSVNDRRLRPPLQSEDLGSITDLTKFGGFSVQAQVPNGVGRSLSSSSVG